MPHKEVLEEICEKCKGEYCTLKELLLHSGLSDRQAIQIKCIEKFKYEQSQKEGKDIGWDDAHMRWVELGYAAKFAEHYHQDAGFKELYQAICDKIT